MWCRSGGPCALRLLGVGESTGQMVCVCTRGGEVRWLPFPIWGGQPGLPPVDTETAHDYWMEKMS